MMQHGVQEFFVEIRRFERRLAGITVMVGVALLAGLETARIPPVARALREIPVMRFGFEGPEQYVRRIELKAESGSAPVKTGLEPVYVPRSRRGGARRYRASKQANVAPETRPQIPGEVESEVDLLARALARAANVPLV